MKTYIQRDVSELIAIKDMRLFQNFLALCATRAGQLLNLSALANASGISQPTAKSWLSALESSYIVFLLPPYFENYSKRVVKTPKLYFYDTGLLCYLLKLDSPEQVQLSDFKGSLFENMMIAEYVKSMQHSNQLNDIWFWRDAAGNEVDLIIQAESRHKAVEFKATHTIMPNLFKGLNFYETISKKTSLRKYLVYGGDERQERTAATVLPWKSIGNTGNE